MLNLLVHHVTSRFQKVNLNPPLHGIFYPSFLSVDGICRSAAGVVLFYIVLCARCSAVSSSSPRTSQTTHSPVYKCFLFGFIAYLTRRTVCLKLYRYHGKFCTAECGTLSVAVGLFMSSALRRAVNAGRRANCVIGRYAEIQL